MSGNRIVVKLGTSTLTGGTLRISRRRLLQIARQVVALREAGHEVILFHILDEAEVHFPFSGLVEFEDVESEERVEVDAQGIRGDYLAGLAEFQAFWKQECGAANVDYVPMDTSVGFDKALLEYLVQRQRRFA